MKIQPIDKFYQDIMYKKWVQNVQQNRIDSAQKIKDFINRPTFPMFPDFSGGYKVFNEILDKHIKDAKEIISKLWR